MRFWIMSKINIRMTGNLIELVENLEKMEE